MECPHCRFTIDPQATICNKCGRFVSVGVEQAISQIVAAAETDPAGSKAGFEALYQQVRPGDREFLAHRVAYLMGQVHRPPTVPHSQPAAAVQEGIHLELPIEYVANFPGHPLRSAIGQCSATVAAIRVILKYSCD